MANNLFSFITELIDNNLKKNKVFGMLMQSQTSFCHQTKLI